MLIHTISGFLILFATIALSIVGIKISGWYLGRSIHDILGLAVFFAVTFVTLQGLVVKNRQEKLRWRSRVIGMLKFSHKIAGYLIVLVA